MNEKRIKKVIAFLNKLPDKHFNLALVVDHATDVEDLETIAKTKKENPDCGTTACLFGWFPGIFPLDYSWEKKPWGAVIVVARDGDEDQDYSNHLQNYLELPRWAVDALCVDRHIPSRLRGEEYNTKTTAKELAGLLKDVLDGEVTESNYRRLWFL